MADVTPYPEPSDNDDTRTPRWVKAFVIFAIILLVLFLILMITGGHGPGRHT